MMRSRQHKFIAATLLMVILFSAVFNVPAALAEGGEPTEPPVATEVGSESQAESTPEPTQLPEEPQATPEAVASPEPVAPTGTPVAGVLADVPEETSLVVLDEQGQPVALGTQETADAVAKSDPVWCPAGQFPGGAGCSVKYDTITDLLTAMRDNPGAFAANGTIFLETTTFTTPLILNDSAGSLSSAYASLSTFNLTIRGGWDGVNSGSGAVSGTNALFNNEGYILIGSLANPWVGNIKLEDIEVRAASVANAITIYTSSGDIEFDDVDVADQTGDKYLVYLHSLTGDIMIGNGSNFDGNDQGNNESQGFYAQTGGSITIDGTGNSQYTFRDNEGAAADTHNGAILIAPTVTLTNVISRANDGNGIEIAGANLITLTNVTSSVNQPGGAGNGLSGVLIIDSPSTIVNVHGGTFAKNGRFGIELFNGTGTLVFHSAPTCPTTGNTANGSGCYNVTPVSPTAVPTQPTPTQPTPTEPSPTQPTATEPSPTQPTATEPAPTEPTSTQPAPTQSTPVPTQSTPVPTQSTAVPSTGSASPDPGTGGASGSSSLGSGSSSAAIIPLTGGELADLACDSVFMAFGVRLSFFELCDLQTTVDQVAGSDLPGDVPQGFTFVMGLDLSILDDGQELDALPAGSGVQLDFPVGADDYAVLYWDEATGEWIEVASELDPAGVSGALGSDAGNGLYRLNPSLASFLQVLTTDKIGIFVLVQK